jgi:MoxR-like ATPase
MGMQQVSTPIKGFRQHEQLKEIKHDNLRQRIIRLLEQLSAGMHEREQTLAVSLLGAIAGHNTFLYGPPGTAKSLISRRLAAAFEQPRYFEYLMNRFSTPEEVFGPISLKELKEDRYTRQIEGYLPTADFAFLDEIWKSSPAILNNLLTIINEHIYKNGKEQIQVPLKALISASNEVPAENQGLDALYDRFIIRLMVPPIQEEANFNALLNARPSSEKPEVEENLRISFAEISQWRQQLHDVQLGDDTLLIIKYIRNLLSERFDELGVYVSDRRWQRAAMLLKASAFINGRKETNHSDVILLKYCLWSTPDNQPKVVDLVMESIKQCGFNGDVDIYELDKKKEDLDKEIHKELYHSADIYETVKLEDNKEYFKKEITFESKSHRSYNEIRTIYIPASQFKSKDNFHPADEDGNERSNINVSFDEQGSCILSYTDYRHNYKDVIFKPNISFHKGDKKNDINKRLIQSISGSVAKLRKNCQEIKVKTQSKLEGYRKNLTTPFATPHETDIAVQGVLDQIEQLKLRIADCERLEALCK